MLVVLLHHKQPQAGIERSFVRRAVFCDGSPSLSTPIHFTHTPPLRGARQSAAMPMGMSCQGLTGTAGVLYSGLMVWTEHGADSDV